MVWPLFCNATASLSWLFETHNSGRIGSPSVAGSMMRRRSSISVVSWLHRRRRPPPLRLTRPFGNGVASRSFRPRPMVERASPVILEIASRPPRPAARTSPAANTLRPRSSSFEPTDSHLCRIAFASIMPTRILPGRYFRNPGALSHLATSRQSKNRFICFGSLPYGPRYQCAVVLDHLLRDSCPVLRLRRSAQLPPCDAKVRLARLRADGCRGRARQRHHSAGRVERDVHLLSADAGQAKLLSRADPVCRRGIDWLRRVLRHARDSEG